MISQPSIRKAPHPTHHDEGHAHLKVLCRALDISASNECALCCLKIPALHTNLASPPHVVEFQRITDVSLRSREILYRESSLGESVYFIRHGLIKLIQYQPNGRERVLRLLQTGNMLGLESLSGTRYHHEAVALSQVKICRIPHTLFRSLIAQMLLRFEDLMLRWQQNLDLADACISQFSTGSIQGRVARLLLFLTTAGDLHHCTTINLLNREDMAATLGVASESVCRTISHFRQIGILRLSDTGQYQCDIEALQKIAAD